METDLALTYQLIYVFLRKQEQTKAAEAVKKAARNVIVLKDDLQPERHNLDEIVRQWKALQAADSSSESDSSDDSSDDSSSSSSSDSSSSDSSSSSDEEGSSSSESDSDNEEETQSKKVTVTLPCAERDTSVTLSSDAKAPEAKVRMSSKKTSIKESSESGSDSDDSTSESSSHKKPIAKVVSKKDGDSSDSESGSSTSGSDSDDSTSESASDKKPVAKVTPKKGSSSADSSDSESTSSSSESESDVESNPSSNKNPIKANVVSSKSHHTNVKSTSEVETRVTKKRKTSESGAAVATAVTPIPQSDDVVSFKSKNTQSNNKSKPRPSANERFTRIKPQAIPPEQLLDNGYEAKGGIDNDYGTRAHRDLIVTRGAGFRKEKNKKKRGSYRGGEITMQSHSIKFTD